MQHHRRGRIQLRHIHDRRNLIALCSICHFAFDQDEWCFFPEQLETWLPDISATPQRIPEYNRYEELQWRRFLIDRDSQSTAYNDDHYRAAFVDTPLKSWKGEAGSVILRSFGVASSSRDEMDPETRQAIRTSRALQDIWLDYQGTCTVEDCKLCSHSNEQDAENESDNGAEDDDNDTDDDNDATDGNHDGDLDEKGNDRNLDEVLQDKDSWHKKDGGNKKRRATSYQQQHGHTANVRRHGSRRVSIRGITKNRGKRWRVRGKEKDWLTTAPYDETVPYSHRYGYTFADYTSNDHMKDWQISRGILSS